MSLPIQALTQAQRYWYAQLVIAAILADQEISQPETEYIKQIALLVKKPEHKQDILTRIAKKSPPPISKPTGIHKEMLAAVFMELSLIMISDIDFADEEREFLDRVYKSFGFTEIYYHKLLGWCEDGLAWKSEQMKLALADGKTDSVKVPVSELNPEQQLWYAETLIATILSDEVLDQAEVKFLKTAISLVSDDRHRQELTNQIRNKKTPALSEPPDFSHAVLIRIFIEVLLIISADESLDPQEESYLRNLADLCGFSDELFQRLMSWCQEGIRWKASKNPLIATCEIMQEGKGSDLKIFKGEKQKQGGVQVFSRDTPGAGGSKVFTQEEEAAKEPPPPVEEAPEEVMEEPAIEVEEDFNSVEKTDLDCFICGTEKSVRFYQLDPQSHKPSHNIFGIPVFLVNNDGFDFVDYNRCKVAVCTSCYFASPQKMLFKAGQKAKLPQPLRNPRFKKYWLKDQEEKSLAFKHHKNELSKANRALAAVVKSYQMAIRASSALAEINKSSELEWHSITLKLTLAEVLMSHGKSDRADAMLQQISEKAVQMFEGAKQKFIAFRSGRVILLIALYFDELKTAAEYHKYFTQVRNNELKSLNDNDKTLFKRIYGEVSRAFENQRKYTRQSLNGFHLD
jgi:hypothetical protein